MASVNVWIQSELANWDPWSLFMISGETTSEQCLFQGIDTEADFHADGKPPGQNLAAIPIYDSNQVQKPAPHLDKGDVNTPDLIGPINRQVLQQIGPDLMRWMLLAGIGFLVDWSQPEITGLTKPLHSLG